MNYYLQRYDFHKPDIEYVEQKDDAGKKIGHEALMTVGGRRIGMGSGKNRERAQDSAYLDVTQYLDSCDEALWEDFQKAEPTLSGAYAPRLVFQMSDQLNEDIYGLCSDIKQSKLYQTAPKTGAVQLGGDATQMHRGHRPASSPEVIAGFSTFLKDKLDKYREDPATEKMRTTRAALPIYTKADDVLETIENNDVTVLMAATGSGKTTQIPQMILDRYIDKGRGAECNVFCTQPRRLAAKSVAERVASERCDKLGAEVGYHIRFDSNLPQPDGSITFLTTGIFHKRMQGALENGDNRGAMAAMDRVSHIIVDEAHERDIDTDLILVVLKRLMADRKKRGIPLKVILMSATIDPTLFQNYFKDERGIPAPVTEVPGRTYPVERKYLDDVVPMVMNSYPSAETKWISSDKTVKDYLLRELSQDPALFGPDTGIESPIPLPLVALTIHHLMQRENDDGHTLVFLPGWDEIKKTADILTGNDRRGRLPKGVDLSDKSKFSVHFLHSQIPIEEQREVFNPPPEGVRRIILSTNIAETSVTIPDVTSVVDAGRLKETRFDPDKRMSSLVSAWVSKSNLNQRAGRAGRHRSGEYFGLISNMRYEALASHSMVEIKREDLSNVVMHVKVSSPCLNLDADRGIFRH